MPELIAGAMGGGCFLGHTLVRTPDGQRRLDELQPGDLVLSFDDHGQFHPAKILKVHVHEGERVVRYRLWGGGTLDATPNHWVLNQFNAFVEIGTLGPDDCLVDANNHLRPIVDRADLCIGTVYNLTVEGHHTFIANNVRVHNAGLGLGIAGAGGGGGGGGGSGKGGGGGEQRTPIEERDNLDSRQYAQIVDLISEGEIQGLKNGYQSIFLNNTPLQNANGSYNFKNVEVQTRNGTQNQAYIPGTSDIEDEKPVSITVEASTPITRTISDTTTNAVRVTITVPQLQQIQDNGDIVGTSVRLQIQIQYNGGGYSVAIDDTISGRTGDAYQRDYLIGLGGAFPVDVRVVRVTPDSTSAKLSNAFSWTSYTEITWAKLRYPNSALVSLRVDAEQFNSIPSRSYLIRGIKVQIPNNATVDQSNGRLIYNGIWNGTFGAAQWCSDPAWVLWDLLTNKRYGFGDHISASQLDKWAFFAASQYASALVPDGFGGYEPRFSCNVNTQTQEEAYKLINDLCSVFRVMPYWSTGTLTISQDKPSDPAYLFTLANVSEEGFRYESSSLKNRPTVAVVSYFDIAAKDKAYEVVEDAARIAKYGVVKTEIDAFACTSRGQAKRLGEWLIYTEWEESETVSFVASIDAGVLVRPGQIIEISDPVRAGSRRGGRISSATTTTVTIDSTADIEGLPGGYLSVIKPDGAVETQQIFSRTGNVVTLVAPLSVAPNPNSVWVWQTSNIQTSTWRVLAIQEQEECKYAISALAYNASKYDYIELDRPLQKRDITDLNIIPPAPQNLRAEESLFEDNGRALAKIVLSWRSVLGVSQYSVRWRVDEGNWSQTTVQRPDYEIRDTVAGRYEIQVFSLNAALRPSVEPARLDFRAVGKTAPPGNVQNLSFEAISYNSGRLRWDQSTDLDVKVGGRIHIRHSSKTDGTGSWANSIDLIPAKSGASTEAIIPLVEGEVLVKFEDDGGRQSVNETSVIIDLPDALAPLPVITRREDGDTPPFQGNKSGTIYDVADDVLKLDGDFSFDTIPDVDAMTDFDTVGNTLASGTYEFLNVLDLEGVYSLDLARYFVTRGNYPSDNIDGRTALIDLWSDFDGLIPDKVNAKLMVRTTDKNYSGTYTQSGTTVTVTVTAHGYTAGQSVTVDFMTGTAVDGTFTIATVPDANTLTYTAATSLTTNGIVRLTGSGTWGSYQEFVSGTFKGRAFQFRADLSTQVVDQNIFVDELGYQATFQRRTEHSDSAVASGAAAKAITFANAFWTGTTALGGSSTAYLPSIGITAHNMGSGDYFDVTSISKTGFTVTFRNSAGTAVNRNFNWSAVGYGKAG